MKGLRDCLEKVALNGRKGTKGQANLRVLIQAEDEILELFRGCVPDEEYLSEKVHKAYCQYQKNIKNKEYWTKGDYSKLTDEVKEADRYTVRAVIDEINKRIDE